MNRLLFFLLGDKIIQKYRPNLKAAHLLFCARLYKRKFKQQRQKIYHRKVRTTRLYTAYVHRYKQVQELSKGFCIPNFR
jgi:hypothetical protein